MAIEPKTPRKRAVKKTSAKAQVDLPVTEVTEEKKTTRKKAAAVPVAIFQAAPEKLAPVKPVVKKEVSEAKSRKKAAATNEKPEITENPAADSESSDSEERANRNRRRRRGGRGRRKPGSADAANTENAEEGSSEETADEDSADGTTSTRRRRRRRATGEGVTPGETIEEDGVITVVKVREKRERPARTERTDRSNQNRNRRDRYDRNDRSSRSDYREPYRKRGTIITDGEFLARRENVDREMLVRQIADRTQIAVIEDGIMVEHYVNRNSNQSYVGNVYLGRVQNVLPSMEAAFVDIGKGRNAVLYAGEVNWDAAGISESAPRKIETVLKTGQPVLVQVTKDPIGQKGARLTSQISLPGRYVVYVPGGGMSGISKRLPEEERSRLKSILKNLIPEEAGVMKKI
jgi:ribonuclease E